MNERENIISALSEEKEGGNPLDLAKAFKENGMSQKEMITLFDSLREEYQSGADETRLNIILDTMDYITGWCASDKRLF